MNLSNQIAKHLRDIYFGNNWTATNLKDQLADVTWQQATTKIYSLNTIAALVYHMQYYVIAALEVLQGKPLTAKDIYSFDLPPIQSQKDWEKLLERTWMEAEQLASLIELLPDGQFWEDFSDKKYDNYYRNLHGIIEHIYYHFGQVVLIKKILLQQEANDKQV